MNVYHVLTQAAGWIWQTSVAATLATMVIAVLQAVLPMPPRLRLALWWLVVVRLLMPVTPSSPLSVANIWPAQAASENRSLPLSPSAPVAGPEARPGVRVAVKQPAGDWRILAACIWALGALVYVTVVLLQHGRLAAWVRRQPALGAVEELVGEAASLAGLSQPVSVIATETLSTPAVFGWLRPRIVLPAQLLGALDRQQLRFVLLHELLHIKRRDVLQNWLFIVLQSLHWFNPAIWYAMRRLRAERELVCDRNVLTRLAAGARQAYGATLIEVAAFAELRRRVPTLVPILTQKNHLQRRVQMIANYKPASRTVGVISALILAATAWVVLTGAADKPVAVAPAQREGTASGAESPRAQPQHLAHLENELNKLKRQLREQAAVVDRLREELEISPLEESSQATDPELLRKMESMRVEQAAEYEQVRNLHKALSELPRKELLRALPTAAPDALLLSLIEQHTRAEQSVTETLHTHGAEHPSARTAKRTLEQIETQMDQRLEGILEGLSVRMRSAQATREHLEQEASKMKSSQIERTITSRPYFRAKRELEILEGLYDTLRQRFIQAQIDAGPPAPPSSK